MEATEEAATHSHLITAFLFGLAGFLGVFTAVNLLGGLFVPTFDVNLTWIDVRMLPKVIRHGFLAMASAAMLLVAFIDVKRKTVQVAISAALLVVVGATIHNSWQFYHLWERHSISPNIPVPLSLVLAVLLLLLLAHYIRRQRSGTTHRRRWHVVVGVLTWIVLFPIFQMYSLGQTDYRKPSDVAVVFGARVFKDGSLSDALFDRVRTACELYHSGLVRKILMSGGPGDGAIREVEAMKKTAVVRGVRPEDVIVDPDGINTHATVSNTKRIAECAGWQSLILVSHFYHLPRAKLAFQRAGLEAVTVPARESYLLRKMPIFIMREVAAYWTYYLGIRRR